MIVIGLIGYSYILKLVLKDSDGVDQCCSLMVRFLREDILVLFLVVVLKMQSNLC